MTRSTLDRILAAALFAAIVLWWVGGLAYRKVYDEPYPALMMPDFRGDVPFPAAETTRLRLEIDATLADGSTLTFTPKQLTPDISAEARKRVFWRMLPIDATATPPTLGPLPPEASGWLRTRVAEHAGVSTDEIREVGVSVVEDAYSIHASPPKTGSRRIERRLVEQEARP